MWFVIMILKDILKVGDGVIVDVIDSEGFQ